MIKRWKKQSGQKIPEAAYDWMARLELGDITPEEFEAYLDWRDAEPAHASAMQSLQQSWSRIKALPVPRPAARMAPARQKLMMRRPARRWAAACCVLLVVAGLGYVAASSFLGPAQNTAYAAARAEQRTIVLDDGSSVHLNALSKVVIDYSADQRRVYLNRGEALFDVAHNPARPFFVFAGTGRVQAIGTQFDVKLSPDDTVMVTLVKGVVRVSKARDATGAVDGLFKILSQPGEQAAIRVRRAEAGQTAGASTGIEVTPANKTSFPDNLAWRQGRLVFRGEKLADALYEINRHSNHLILLDDSVAARMPVYAVFNTGDWRGALSAIIKSYPVKAVQISANETRLVSASGEMPFNQ